MTDKEIAIQALLAAKDSADWAFWAMIGTWASGIATFLAVLTSLYIALRKPKLHVGGKVRLSRLISSEDDIPVVNLTVVNKSQHPIKIKGVFWVVDKLGRKREFQQLFNNPFSDDLPIKLEHGDEANYRISIKKIENGWIERMARRLSEEGANVKNVRCVVQLSTGERFHIKMNSQIKKKIASAMTKN